MGSEEGKKERYPVIQVGVGHMQQFLMVSLLIALSCVVVLIYRSNRLFTLNIPERCVMLAFSESLNSLFLNLKTKKKPHFCFQAQFLPS